MALPSPPGHLPGQLTVGVHHGPAPPDRRPAPHEERPTPVYGQPGVQSDGRGSVVDPQADLPSGASATGSSTCADVTGQHRRAGVVEPVRRLGPPRGG